MKDQSEASELNDLSLGRHSSTSTASVVKNLGQVIPFCEAVSPHCPLHRYMSILDV